MAKGTWVAETEFGEIDFVILSSNPGKTKGQIRYEFVEDWSCGELTLTSTSSVVDDSGWVLDRNNKLKVTSKLPKVFWLITFMEYTYDGTWDESFWTITLEGAYDPITQTFTGTWEELIGKAVCSGEWEAKLQE